MNSITRITLIALISTFMSNAASVADSSENPKTSQELRYEQISKKLLILADQGDAQAQAKLYVMYLNGLGVPKDIKRAMEWCIKAANNGNADAQAILAIMYENGDGVPQSYKIALEWYLKAAAQGNISAQNNVGRIYLNAWGVSQDFKEAMNWFMKAAAQGDAIAQANVGLIYFKGQNIPKDYQMARSWLLEAANQGYAKAQFYLGIIYGRGLGVDQDSSVSIGWFQKAAQQGHPLAQETLELNAIAQEINDTNHTPKITNIQTKGNLASTRNTGCVAIDTLTNQEIPPNIYRGAADCIKTGAYDKASKLIFLARFYGLFDGERIADSTAAQGAIVLEMNMLAPVPIDIKTKLQEHLTKNFNIGSEPFSAFCQTIAKKGYPTYHPDYLIQHGISAFSQQKGNGLKTDFNAEKTWMKILSQRCKKAD